MFVVVEVVVMAEAATKLDDDEEDPQPAKASAPVTVSATAQYRIDVGESAMLTGVLLRERKTWIPAPRSCAAIGVKGMSTGSGLDRRRGSRPPAPEVSPDAPRGVAVELPVVLRLIVHATSARRTGGAHLRRVLCVAVGQFGDREQCEIDD